MTVPNASETSPEPWRRSQAGANTSPTARPPASTEVRPSLPAFLRDQTVGDAGAAARAQYGGEVLAPLTNKRAPFSTISKEEENPAGSRPRPSLPTGPKFEAQFSLDVWTRQRHCKIKRRALPQPRSHASRFGYSEPQSKHSRVSL